MSTPKRQTHCCEWLLRAAFSLSSQPDTATTVGDDSAADLQPPAHAGSTRHWIPCRAGYHATWGPRLQCIPGKDTARAHSHAGPHAARLAAQSRRHMPSCQRVRAQHAMPTAGGARDRWLSIDAVCATAAAAATTICEGVTMARDKPVFASSM